jgi:REP element-mobilizing transposase RayT
MTVLITRRSLRRTHLFRPDPEIYRLYVYVLAVVAKRHGVLVHAAVLMSTHEHLVVTDLHGRLPSFMRELHRLFALGLKILRKWEGAVWDHERPSVVHLMTPEAVVEKLAYLMANPVSAGLVRCARDWPGVMTLPEQLGCATFRARRPAYYFDEHNPLWPEQVELELSMPLITDMTEDQIREAVARELSELERQAQADLSVRGRAAQGASRVCRASPYERSKSWEAIRSRNPHFAVGRHQLDARIEAVARLRAFRRAYSDALMQWRNGLREVMFPFGTWLMRVTHGAAVSAA